MIKEEETGKYPWPGNRRYNAHSSRIAGIFGGRVQKVSIDAGFTCPNRDGTKGRGGCTYCNNDAFNPSYCTPAKSIRQQIEEGIAFHKSRYRRAVGFFAYFQAYSNTYETVEKLKEMYEEALSVPGILGIVAGTRPDCIDDARLDYFVEIASRTYLSIEYGIESCYDKTLERINRGHDFKQSAEAVRATSARGINCGAHLIFGLPGESRKEMLNEASIISELPLTSVKFHQLQIIRATMMEREYRDNPHDFNLFGWEEYRDFVIEFMEMLNPDIQIDRFTGEAPLHLVVSPRWGLKRSDSLISQIEDRMEELDSWQGKKIMQNRHG